MPKAEHLKFEDSYKQELLKLFKALPALTRETHVKQVSFPGVGMGMLPREIVLNLGPQLTQEPLATVYLRRGQAYRFVRVALVASFGSKGLAGMNRRTEDGAVNMRLDQELRVMEAPFYGAYPVMLERYGKNVLNRDEMRALCDRYKTQEAILEQLK